MKEKNILVTGSSGFLGRSVTQILKDNAIIHGISRNEIHGKEINIQCDLSKSVPILEDIYFEKIVHIAGKAHSFPKTPAEEKEFFKVNYQGTKNLLIALDRLSLSPKTFVFISTVAVYGLVKGEKIKETTELNPNTPYGNSKLKAEREIITWCEANNVHYIILRLPLIVGINPPGNLGDMKKAINKGYYVKIGNNKARKSVVIADDVGKLITRVEGKSGIYHLTDGAHPRFHDIENAISQKVGKKIKIRIPVLLIRMVAKVGDFITAITKKDMPISTLRLEKITSTLTFDDLKAREELDWKPNDSIEFIKSQI